MKPGRRTLYLLFLVVLIRTPSAEAGPNDLASLLEEVEAIDSPGVPGAIAAVGPDAFPVVLGRRGKERAPVVAAATAGHGRVVAFAHGGYLSGVSSDRRDTGRLVRNAVLWTAGGRRAHPLRVAVSKRARPMVEGVLSNDAVALVPFDPATLERRAPDADVVVMGGGGNLSDHASRRLTRWIRAGGGCVTAATGWGWQQLHPERDLARAFWLNRALGPLGLVFTDATVRDTVDDGFRVARFEETLFEASGLATRLIRDPELESFTDAERRQAGASLLLAAASIDPEREPLGAALEQVRRRYAKQAIPTREAPLRAKHVARRVALLLDLAALDDASPDARPAHPAAATFPGEIPEEGAETAALDLTLDLEIHGWRSTGRYAAPGASIRVKQVTGPVVPGLRIRIGCHTDRLDGKDRWDRAPRVSRSDALGAGADGLRTSSAFGGLIYVAVPPKAPAGRIRLSLRGAVPAPLFVAGETDADAWREEIRHRPAPWGEVATDRVIVTVPSEHLRSLDDPERLARTWDSVLDACAELAGRRPQPRRPERIVSDVQISAGYMHSGYPIMTHLDAASTMVSADALLAGNWGLYHELGHNHQQSAWTFGGTGEVTCNLFTLYVYDKVCGIDLKSDRLHGAIRPERRAERRRTFYARAHARAPVRGPGSQADFARWRKDPFLALTTYVEVVEAFGWEPLRDVFDAYRSLPDAERPRTDGEKRDQWAIRLSERLGKNLAPFLRGWSVPVSPQAERRIAHLPVWEP